MVSTSSARERRTIRPMASLPYLLAWAPNSPSTPSVLPPPRAPPKKISNTWHFSSRTWARLPRGDQAILTGRSSAMARGPSLQVIGLVLDRLRFPCRIVHQRRDFDHVAVRYLRLMRLPRLAPATIQQGLRSCHAGSIRRMGFIHDGCERLYRLFGVHSCQRRDFERSFSHLNSPRLPATAIGLLDFCPDFIGMEVHSYRRSGSASFSASSAQLPAAWRRSAGLASD